MLPCKDVRALECIAGKMFMFFSPTVMRSAAAQEKPRASQKTWPLKSAPHSVGCLHTLTGHRVLGALVADRQLPQIGHKQLQRAHFMLESNANGEAKRYVLAFASCHCVHNEVDGLAPYIHFSSANFPEVPAGGSSAERHM